MTRMALSPLGGGRWSTGVSDADRPAKADDTAPAANGIDIWRNAVSSTHLHATAAVPSACRSGDGADDDATACLLAGYSRRNH